MAQQLRDITTEEWDAYEWLEISEFGNAVRVYLRGAKRTSPPDDGYIYDEATQFGDTEQKWTRRKTPIGE